MKNRKIEIRMPPCHVPSKMKSKKKKKKKKKKIPRSEIVWH